MIATEDAQKTIHLLQDDYRGVGGMRELYRATRTIPTSTNADIMLIRSYIAYHLGRDEARRASIRPSRGHSYKITNCIAEGVVRVQNPFDHRTGVSGLDY